MPTSSSELKFCQSMDYLVLTFFAGPRLFLLGSSLRLRDAAVALPFLPSACALDCGRHLCLPSEDEPLAQSPRILPSGPNLTHFSLNHFLRFSSISYNFITCSCCPSWPRLFCDTAPEHQRHKPKAILCILLLLCDSRHLFCLPVRQILVL